MQTILILLTLLLRALPCQAQEMVSRLNVGTLGGGVAGCSYVSKDTASGTDSATSYIGYTGSYDQAAMSFTAAYTYTLKRITVSMKRIGTGGFATVTVKLCSNNATGPVPQTCTAIGTITVSEINDADYEDFTLDYATGYGIENTVRYWISYAANSVGDTSNYVLARASALGTENRASSDEVDDSNWTNRDTSATAYFTAYSCE